MRFEVLGPLEVWDDGRRLAIGGPQQRAVLAVLLLHANQVVSIDRLIDDVWGERPPVKARSLLQGCVAGLRRALRTGCSGRLITRPPGYLLRVRPDESDVDEFEGLVEAARRSRDGEDLERAAELFGEALALWRGPALGGVDVEAGQVEAARLDERRLATVEERIDVELRLGRHAELVAGLQTLVREHPLREHLWAQLIGALYAAQRQAEALEAYGRVRETLVEQLGVEPGAVLRELHRAVLAGSPPSPAASPAATAAVSLREVPVVPSQLPATVVAFTGRDADLKQLDELMAGEGAEVPIGLITGTAGVGKTALALRWAQSVRDRFDGGQLFANLHGHSAGPMARPLDVLAGFYHALGSPPGPVPLDEDRAAAHYRTLLAGQRVLVVLDNAASAEQVRPLLPGPGCAALVTSRNALGGLIARDGARYLRLDVLTTDDALTLLGRIVGAERMHAQPGAASELARLCAYLPLALRIAGADLVLRPHRSIADQVAELRAGDPLSALRVDGSAVREAFDLSYQALDPVTRALFRRIGLAPGVDVTAALAGVLIGADVVTAGPLLDGLVRAHLLDEPSAGRYTVHDLLRRYAAERAAAEEDATERGAVVDRLYDWWLATADRVYPHMLRPPESEGAGLIPSNPMFDWHVGALAWLGAERRNLVAAVRAGAENGPCPASWGRDADAARRRPAPGR